jgi:hypothetical protein
MDWRACGAHCVCERLGSADKWTSRWLKRRLGEATQQGGGGCVQALERVHNAVVGGMQASAGIVKEVSRANDGTEGLASNRYVKRVLNTNHKQQSG